MMDQQFVTITGINHYFGMRPFRVGGLVKLVKEPKNAYDAEAIRAELPFIGTIGYVANSTHTVYAGTYSAGRLFDKIEGFAYGHILFCTHSSVIALVISKDEMDPSRGWTDPEKISIAVNPAGMA